MKEKDTFEFFTLDPSSIISRSGPGFCNPCDIIFASLNCSSALIIEKVM